MKKQGKKTEMLICYVESVACSQTVLIVFSVEVKAAKKLIKIFFYRCKLIWLSVLRVITV